MNKASILLWGIVTCIGWGLQAQNAQHLSTPIPGGIPGLPTITGQTVVSNTVTVTWDGPSGYYQLYQSTNVNGPQQPVGTPYNLLRTATVTNPPSPVFFRVAGTRSPYAGSSICTECHPNVVNSYLHSVHANAFRPSNTNCWSCHSTGFRTPTGFPTNSQLSGVQCESCHGPAANHVSNPSDFTAIPRVELAGTMCGGCHQAVAGFTGGLAAIHLPYYNEWSQSPHQAVLQELQEDFAASPGMISTCGRCHSGTARDALLQNDAVLPDAQEASAVGVACTTCHDPHRQLVYTNVLTGAVYTNTVRNPLSSLQDYHTTGNWTTNYNPAVNICAQCHNDRNARYTDTARPPHHSPQYNILIGTSGVINTNNPGAPHFNARSHALLITNQCVSCHMQTSAPGTAGHTFGVTSYAVCAGCHVSEANAQGLADLARTATQLAIDDLHVLLDTWATNEAPAILGTSSYGTRAWEYTTPGDLSPGGPGPNATEQALIPTNIKIARYNLYLVLYDASFGSHNGRYGLDLLELASSLVAAELAK